MADWICTYDACRKKAVYQWWDDDETRFYTCREHSLEVCKEYSRIGQLPEDQWHLKPLLTHQLETTASRGMGRR